MIRAGRLPPKVGLQSARECETVNSRMGYRPSPTARPRLADVAREAGVTTAMASLVLAGKRGAKSPSPLALRVRAAARRLGYAANRAARSLSTGRPSAVAAIVGHHETESAAWLVLRGFEAAMGAAGVDVIVRDGAGDERAAARQVWQSAAVAGVAYLIWPGARRPVRSGNREAFPSVAIGPDLGDGSIGFDPAPGIRDAIADLARLGHRKVGLVHHSQVAPRNDVRIRTAAAACKALGIAAAPVVIDLPYLELTDQRALSLPRLRAAVAAALGRAIPFTAAFCWNDPLALLVIDWAHRSGRRVPEDLSVVGFDDFFSRGTVPALSTVSAGLAELGAAGANALLERIAAVRERRRPGAPGTVSSRYIPRDSAVAARANSPLMSSIGNARRL